MRQNGLGTLTLDDARTWIEETGLCLFLPKRQFSSSVAPSFVEAVAGRADATPDPKIIAQAEELLIRLENDGVAVRLNLLGQPGEQPDFVVAAWVLPYVYALRGDRDWRRSPQLTGSRQVSQLAVHVYKQLEGGDSTVAQLKQALGREVSEAGVVRAITELWQQLRIIPVIAARGQAAKWQLLRTRFQRAIAEGASTSQVTAISVLASIYLQAVIAASMEDVELFLAPLTARSKIREVIRGLVATRQVHTISLGHAPHFYVAGTLPEFDPIPSLYASSSMPAYSYFNRSFERDDELPSPSVSIPSVPFVQQVHVQDSVAPDREAPRAPARRSSDRKAEPTRSHFNRAASHTHDREPAGSGRTGSGRSAQNSRPVRGSSVRNANGKHTASRTGAGSRVSGSNGSHSNGRAATPSWSKRSGTVKAKASSVRKEARSARNGRPALAAAGRTGASGKRFFSNRTKQGTKKRG